MTKVCQLRELMTRQAVLAVVNVQHRKSLRTRISLRRAARLRAIKPGLIVCVRGKNPPTSTSELTSLPAMSWMRFAKDLYDGRIEQICIHSDLERMKSEAEELRQLHAASTTESEDTLSAKTKKERFDGQSWDSLKTNPFYDVLREHMNVIPDEIPAELPQDKGIQHEIDLVPGTKYCVTRQWPLPRDQVKAIDDFCESRRQAGQVRESKSPHSAPTFCVKKPQGGWRIVHAYNKLNDAAIPAQTPIPRKDVIIDSMAKSTIYSALDLRDGFYHILMRESDITLTAGLKNAPATFNRCVTHLLRSVHDFAPSYFDDVFVHSPAVNGKTDVEVHKEHLRKLLGLMRKHKHKLYANLKKCIFGASEIPILGCLVGKNGLLKKEAKWKWPAECQQAFDAVKQGLTEAPILVVADQDRPFHVVCDASDFAIGYALMQHDHDPRDRVVYYQSRQLKPAERNYPVHDKELLAMKYALAKFRVYLLGSGPFVVYTNHASLRTAVKSPHISQRMARGLSFFAEYDFRVEYKPGRLNVVADALSRRPDYAVKTADANRIGIVVPNDYDLRMRIMYEYHDAPTAGHPGREKTYVLLTRDFYWNHQYKWVRKLRFNHFRYRRSVGSPSLWTLSLVFRLTVSGGLVSWSL
ncbi:hypothetical protein PC120_g26258 [Phytophthora cactorum]|nr:hypothetical protein PC120_g26258 [Phytophthora cactorum]